VIERAIQTFLRNLCFAKLELHIAEDWYRRTALADLLQRCGELFAAENEVLLYDEPVDIRWRCLVRRKPL
jgi:hypothetical protein